MESKSLRLTKRGLFEVASTYICFSFHFNFSLMGGIRTFIIHMKPTDIKITLYSTVLCVGGGTRENKKSKFQTLCCCHHLIKRKWKLESFWQNIQLRALKVKNSLKAVLSCIRNIAERGLANFEYFAALRQNQKKLKF